MTTQWFTDARFGMFIHWGLYSLAGGQWDGMDIPWVSEWLMRKFRIPIPEYEQLAARFTAAGFNAEEWVLAAKQAGMKYMVITSKHHDGFAMFHSKYDAYNIVDATPFGRDPLAELAAACKKHGIRLGFYYSQDQDWHERGASGNDWSFAPEEKTPEAFQTYLDTKVKTQLRELLTNYGDVAIIWFDTPNTITPEQSQDLKDYVHALQPNCLVSGRVGNGKGDYDSLGDNQMPTIFPERPAEGLATMNDSWGYKPFDKHYRSASDIIFALGRMASNNTNYLLNVGPDGNGCFPPQAKALLSGVGEFLAANGEALYGTHGIRRSRPFNFGWGDITAKGNVVYFWLLKKCDGPMNFYGIRNCVLKASVNGMDIPFSQDHRQTPDYHKLALELPEGLALPCIIRVELDGDVDYNPVTYQANTF